MWPNCFCTQLSLKVITFLWKELKWPNELGLKAKFLLGQNFPSTDIVYRIFLQFGKSYTDLAELIRVWPVPEHRSDTNLFSRILNLLHLRYLGWVKPPIKLLGITQLLYKVTQPEGTAASQPTRRETRICLCLWGKLWFRIEHDKTFFFFLAFLVSLGLATHVCKDKSSDYQIVPWTLYKPTHWLYFECLNFFIWYNVDEIHVNILWIFSEFILILWIYHSWLSCQWIFHFFPLWTNTCSLCNT